MSFCLWPSKGPVSREAPCWPCGNLRGLAALALGMVMAMCGQGCAVATVEAVGTLLGGAASAASTGGEVWAMGKLDTAEMAPLQDAVSAARAAASDLALHPLADRGRRHRDPTLVELAFRDDKCARLSVRIDRRAARLVLIRIDVGWFGSQGTAKLFLSRLRAHLPRDSLESRPAGN